MWIVEFVMEGVHEEFTLAPRENKLSTWYKHTHTPEKKRSEGEGQRETEIERETGNSENRLEKGEKFQKFGKRSGRILHIFQSFLFSLSLFLYIMTRLEVFPLFYGFL